MPRRERPSAWLRRWACWPPHRCASRPPAMCPEAVCYWRWRRTWAVGHGRVYSGNLTALPRHYVARERLCLRGTTDYWINAMDGQPFFFVNKEVDPGLLATLRDDLVPWLETNAPASVELQQRMHDDPLQHRFTLVFDREGYSPAFFREMKQRRIALLSYHKYPGDAWPAEEFSDCTVKLAGGEE